MSWTDDPEGQSLQSKKLPGESAYRGWVEGHDSYFPRWKGIFAPFQRKEDFAACCSVGLVFNLAFGDVAFSKLKPATALLQQIHWFYHRHMELQSETWLIPSGSIYYLFALKQNKAELFWGLLKLHQKSVTFPWTFLFFFQNTNQLSLFEIFFLFYKYIYKPVLWLSFTESQTVNLLHLRDRLGISQVQHKLLTHLQSETFPLNSNTPSNNRTLRAN